MIKILNPMNRRETRRAVRVCRATVLKPWEKRAVQYTSPAAKQYQLSGTKHKVYGLQTHTVCLTELRFSETVVPTPQHDQNITNSRYTSLENRPDAQVLTTFFLIYPLSTSQTCGKRAH